MTICDSFQRYCCNSRVGGRVGGRGRRFIDHNNQRRGWSLFLVVCAASVVQQ